MEQNQLTISNGIPSHYFEPNRTPIFNYFNAFEDIRYLCKEWPEDELPQNTKDKLTEALGRLREWYADAVGDGNVSHIISLKARVKSNIIRKQVAATVLSIILAPGEIVNPIWFFVNIDIKKKLLAQLKVQKYTLPSALTDLTVADNEAKLLSECLRLKKLIKAVDADIIHLEKEIENSKGDQTEKYNYLNDVVALSKFMGVGIDERETMLEKWVAMIKQVKKLT